MKSPNLSEQDPIATIFEFHHQVEAAIRKIEESSFDLKKLSIVGKDFPSNLECLHLIWM